MTCGDISVSTQPKELSLILSTEVKSVFDEIPTMKK